MMRTAQDLDELLVKQTQPVAKLIKQTRKYVLEHFPSSVEQVKMGWGVIWFGIGPKMNEQVLAISPHASHVNLEFARGTELDDPKGLLEGTGKRLRHVKIRSADDLQSASLKKLIRQAVAEGPPNWSR